MDMDWVNNKVSQVLQSSAKKVSDRAVFLLGRNSTKKNHIKIAFVLFQIKVDAQNTK